MPRKARVRIEKRTLSDGSKSFRPWIGRKLVGGWVSDEEEALREGHRAYEGVNGAKVDKVTVAEFYERWTRIPGPYTTAKRNRSEPTYRHNAERVSLFATDHGDRLMTQITKAIALDWASENPSRAGTVRTMFNDALRSDVVPFNPFADLGVEGMVKNTRKHIKPITLAELPVLCEQVGVLRDEKWRLMFESAILFSAYTGVRIGELINLRWDDVDLKGGVVHVVSQWRSKDQREGPLKARREGHPPRTIVLFPQAEAVLRLLLDTYGPDYCKQVPGLIFATPRGRRLSAGNHYGYWKEVRAGFLATLPAKRVKELKGDSDSPLHWHDLRHFTASWLLDNGVTAQDAAQQLGHTDGGRLIQELYGHTYEDRARDRMRDAISRADGGGGPLHTSGRPHDPSIARRRAK